MARELPFGTCELMIIGPIVWPVFMPTEIDAMTFRFKEQQNECRKSIYRRSACRSRKPRYMDSIWMCVIKTLHRGIRCEKRGKTVLPTSFLSIKNRLDVRCPPVGPCGGRSHQSVCSGHEARYNGDESQINIVRLSNLWSRCKADALRGQVSRWARRSYSFCFAIKGKCGVARSERSDGRGMLGKWN